MGRLCTVVCWIIVIAFIAGVVWFFFWLGHRQRLHIHVNVESTDLVRFDIDKNQTLTYNLTLTASVRNANWATIYYTKLEARASYDGQEFGVANLPTFTQWQKCSEVIYPAFHGQSQMPSSHVLAKFNSEKGVGLYSIDVKINVEFRMSWIAYDGEGSTYSTSKGYAPQVDCSLRVPMGLNGTVSTGSFNPTDCTVSW